MIPYLSNWLNEIWLDWPFKSTFLKMKSILQVFLALVMCPMIGFSQGVPQAMNYQGVARDVNGQVIKEQTINLRVSINSEIDLNRPVFAELHEVKTSNIGLFNLSIGTGESLTGKMENVDWASASHYLKIDMDAELDGTYEEMGSSQLLTVPYAFYAASSGRSEEGDSRNDPNDWTMNGNSGTSDAINFLGTTDAQDLVFKTNNSEVGRFENGGDLNLAAGTSLRVGGKNLINSLGTSNVHIGDDVASGSTGSGNVAIGRQAGEDLTSGSFNMLIGYRAGRRTTTGARNAMIGFGAGLNNETGTDNAMLGQFAGALGAAGSDNVFIGSRAGYSMTIGDRNVLVGKDAGTAILNGSYNSYLGYRSGYSSNNVENNTFMGYASGFQNFNGKNNSFFGTNAGFGSVNGDFNTFLGFRAGYNNTDGSSNTYVGYNAKGGAGRVNATAIGANAYANKDSVLILGDAAKVGIGTDAPIHDLQVVGDVGVSGFYHDSNGSAGSPGQHLESTAAGTEWVDGIADGVEYCNVLKWDTAGSGHWVASNLSISSSGNSNAHNNMQPYLAVNYCIATVGIFPSFSGGGITPYLGQINIFGFNFNPSGWLKCDGQLLPIAQNSALFSLLGTIYGGDGQTTFAVPDLRGRVPMHFGNGPGLTNRNIGEKWGFETHTLTQNEIPNHSHNVIFSAPIE